MPINRALQKQKAKELMHLSKPSMLYAGIIFVLLSALINWLSLRLTGVSTDTLGQVAQAAGEGNTDAAMRLLTRAMPSAGATVIDTLLQLALMVVGVGFTLFALNTVRRTEPALGNLLDGFGMMPRLLFLLLLEYLLIFLWSLLLVVPGIIAAYRYRLAVYVMLDHPEYTATDCLRESKKLTNGWKMQLFYLDLSFLPWMLAGMLPVIGYAAQVYYIPYFETVRALYYDEILMRQTSEGVFD